MGGKGSGRPGGNPDFKKDSCAAYNVNPTTNRKVIALYAAIRTLPPVDFTDPASIDANFLEYLRMCEEIEIRPTLAGTAMALGLNSSTFHDLCSGRNTTWGGITESGIQTVKNIYQFLDLSFESNMSEETGNPTKWIFLGKNHYGYRDQREEVQVRLDATRALGSSEEVAKRYKLMAGADDDGDAKGPV